MPIHHQIRVVATTLATITIAALMLTACNAAVRRNGADEVSRKLITVWGAEPQNPLLPADTNETGGTKVIPALFATWYITTPTAKPIMTRPNPLTSTVTAPTR